MPKPYKQKMSKTWWLDHPAYRLFMLRELSGVFIAVYFLVLVKIMSKADEPEALAECLASLRTVPWYLFHGVILVFSLLHTVTWFDLAPKAIVIPLGEDRLPGIFITGAHYVGMVAISLTVFWFFGVFS